MSERTPTRPNDAPTRAVLEGACLAALVLLFVALAHSSAARKSPTYDEGVHVMSGAASWHGDRRLYSGNGMLPQLWYSLPLVANDAFRVPDADVVVSSQRVRNFHELTTFLTHVFFYESGNDVARLSATSRLMGLPVGAALVVLVWAWARRLFGAGGGLLAAAACALSPNWIAHARLTNSDAWLTLAFLASLGAVAAALRRPGALRIACGGVLLGALALSKLTAVAFAPIAAGLIALRALDPSPMVLRLGSRSWRAQSPWTRAAAALGVTLAQAGIALAVIWTAYGWRWDMVPEGSPGRPALEARWEEMLSRPGAALAAAGVLRESRLLPEGFVYTAAFVASHDERRAFLLGRTRNRADWRFFPVGVALKTPLGLFALIALAAAAGVARARALQREYGRLARAPEWRAFWRASSPLWWAGAVYWAIALSAPINLGLRHLLPIYAICFVFVGGAATWLRSPRRWPAGAVAAAASALAIASLATWPHYLSFFNSIVGPRDAWRVLSDSSLDWGQDLDELRRWLEDRQLAGPDAPVYLSYFGTADPLYHGLQVRRLPGFLDWPQLRRQWQRVRADGQLEPGVYCISATMLQQVWSREPGAWNAEREIRYRALRERVGAILARADPEELAQAAAGDAHHELRAWRELRLARLCAWLRLRDPDDHVGHSILVYRLGADELAAALESDDWWAGS